MWHRPRAEECADYYHGYISQVPDGDVFERLERQFDETARLLTGLTEEQETRCYAPGKWSLRQLLGHLVDAERIFSYRAMAFARGDHSPIPGMDQDDYVAASNAGDRPLAEQLEEFRTVRAATLALFRSFSPAVAERSGIASDVSFTVRSLAWILAGHELHHQQVVREKYL